jgi:hypothetical protein
LYIQKKVNSGLITLQPFNKTRNSTNYEPSSFASLDDMFNIACN